jgi:plasmid maintenance system antidote protein VapI
MAVRSINVSDVINGAVYEHPDPSEIIPYGKIPRVDPDNMSRAMREACARHDIRAIFRFLIDGGMTQRELAVLVKMNQSEVSAIVAGRRVLAYDVLIRIADGLGIPRGMMGLAMTVEVEVEDVENEQEVDEYVERRKLLAMAGAILFGAPALDEMEPLIVRRVRIDPPRRVGMTDVKIYRETLAQLQDLQQQVGGMACREPLVVTAWAGEQLLKAKAVPEVHRRLRLVVSDAHRSAGWAAGDVGLIDDYRAHTHQALDLAAGSPERIAQVLCTAGSMEKELGDPKYALKLLQLGQVSAADCSDPRIRGVLGGEAVAGYIAFGRPDMAKQELATARGLFADADDSKAVPGFKAYGNGHAMWAVNEFLLGNFEAAHGEIINALQERLVDDVWGNALDTIILALISIQAGEIREGIQQTHRALVLVKQVGSRMLNERMMPLADELENRNDSTCQDLARIVRQQVRSS